MLAEIDARAVQGALVLTGGRPFDDAAGGELQIVEPLDQRGLDVACDQAHGSSRIPLHATRRHGLSFRFVRDV